MILILGKNGQVGRALAALLGDTAIAADSTTVNLAEKNIGEQLSRFAVMHPITTVINAAAYTQVDKAESEPALAMRINGDAVGEIAAWCRAQDALLVHYSTDYVFDGSGTEARCEADPTGPLSAYGASKLLGEKLIAESGARHFIFRTSWVYDAMGKNFFTTMRRLFREREEVSVVADQWGAPTYAPHLAAATITVLDHENAESGIYHLCAGGEATWHGFAQAIFALASAHESGIKCKRVHPITTRDYPTPARRPANSRLDCAKAKARFGVALPDWMDGVNECYERIRLQH